MLTQIFNVVLHNPTTSHQLRKFSQTRFCGENMEFLEKVSRRPSPFPTGVCRQGPVG